jgi:hypothetical protein
VTILVKYRCENEISHKYRRREKKQRDLLPDDGHTQNIRVIHFQRLRTMSTITVYTHGEREKESEVDTT